MSALKNRAFQKRIPLHNDANDCMSISEPYVSLEEYWPLLQSAISFPVATLWTQPLGACSQPGREAHVSVCLSWKPKALEGFLR